MILLKDICSDLLLIDLQIYPILLSPTAVSWISPFASALDARHVRPGIIFKRGIEISALIAQRWIIGTQLMAENGKQMLQISILKMKYFVCVPYSPKYPQL